MARLKQYVVTWTGAPVVGGGVSVFYQTPDSIVGGANELLAFFSALGTELAGGMNISVPSNGDIIEDTTGDKVGSWSDPGTGGTIGTSAPGSFVNGVGMRVVWNTSGIFKGRRVRGSTFLVPIRSDRFEGAGNISGTLLSTVQTAANALVADFEGFTIFSRPSAPAVGENNLVESASVPDFVSWLRGRRT